jgi:hypothetical protein
MRPVLAEQLGQSLSRAVLAYQYEYSEGLKERTIRRRKTVFPKPRVEVGSAPEMAVAQLQPVAMVEASDESALERALMSYF